MSMLLKQVRMHDSVNDFLEEIVEKRVKDGVPNNTKQGVVAELIIEAHKKECK